MSPHDSGARNLVTRSITLHLTQQGALTRAQLAETMQLPRSTVSEHVRTMLRRGELVEGPHELAPPRGRPARVLMLAPAGGIRAVLVLAHGPGLANGPVVAALLDSRGEIRWRQRAELAADPLRTCERLVRAGMTALRLEVDDVAQVVLVVPLPVVGASDAAESRIVYRTQPLGDQPHAVLSRRLGVPALLVNDADAAALGEATFGQSRGSDVVYVKALTGLGMGIVSNGRLRSTTGAAVGEIAHVHKVGGSTVCSCGSVGCWFADAHGDGLGLAVMARHAGANAHTFVELVRACAVGEARALRAVEDVGESIGRVVSSYYLVAQPSLTVLENALGATFSPLSTGLRRGISEHAPRWAATQPSRIERGSLEVPELLGAVAFASHHVQQG